MENLQFIGTDASLEISLFEYHVIAAKNEKDNDYFVVFRVNDDQFDCGHKSEVDLNNLINGEDWAKPKEIQSFLSFIDCATAKELIEKPFIVKLQECISYWGYEKIMGSSYGELMSEAEVRERYL